MFGDIKRDPYPETPKRSRQKIINGRNWPTGLNEDFSIFFFCMLPRLTKVSEVIGVPPNHPFIDGVSLIYHPFMGTPMAMETPIYQERLDFLDTSFNHLPERSDGWRPAEATCGRGIGRSCLGGHGFQPGWNRCGVTRLGFQQGFFPLRWEELWKNYVVI